MLDIRKKNNIIIVAKLMNIKNKILKRANMILTLDFDNNTITTEQGTMTIPDLAEKKKLFLGWLD